LQQGQRGHNAADASPRDQNPWLAQVPSPVRWQHTTGNLDRTQAGD
jgi:hypothetical protein